MVTRIAVSSDFSHKSYSMGISETKLYKCKCKGGAPIIMWKCQIFIAIFIASLGLLGMVVYTIETRIKKIYIRKVLEQLPEIRRGLRGS
jgi:hypothetical protein